MKLLGSGDRFSCMTLVENMFVEGVYDGKKIEMERQSLRRTSQPRTYPMNIVNCVWGIAKCHCAELKNFGLFTVAQ